MSQESILQEAQRLVHGDRGADYGHPLDDFQCTADMWSAYLTRKLGRPVRVEPEDVGPMMICVKLSREAGKHKRDNLVDAAGYAETTMMVKDEKYKRSTLSETFTDMKKLGI